MLIHCRNESCPMSHALLRCIFLFGVLSWGSQNGEGKTNVLGIPLFLLLFLVLRLLLKVPKGTANSRKIEGKGKAS